MSNLLLMRHARAAWSHNESDQERTLSERGRLEAKQMGMRLSARQFSPQTLICSPAARARETTEIVGRLLGFDLQKIIYLDNLYLASPDTLLGEIQTHFASGNLMAVGHNPGMTSLVNRLASGRIDNMPTAAYALFDTGDGLFNVESVYPAGIDFPANPGEPFAA